VILLRYPVVLRTVYRKLLVKMYRELLPLDICVATVKYFFYSLKISLYVQLNRACPETQRVVPVSGRAIISRCQKAGPPHCRQVHGRDEMADGLIRGNRLWFFVR